VPADTVQVTQYGHGQIGILSETYGDLLHDDRVHRHDPPSACVGNPSAGAGAVRPWLCPGVCTGGRGGRLRSRAGRLLFRWAGWVPACRIGRGAYGPIGFPGRAPAGVHRSDAGGAQIRDVGSGDRRTGGHSRDHRRRRCRPVARRRYAPEGRTLCGPTSTCIS
jgi:hypothetical protein